MMNEQWILSSASIIKLSDHMNVGMFIMNLELSKEKWCMSFLDCSNNFLIKIDSPPHQEKRMI